MTPLANKLAKELLLPKSKREAIWFDGPEKVVGAHCFSVTDVLPIIQSLGHKMEMDGVSGRLAFLPFDATWIEWSHQKVGEYETSAVLLECVDDGVSVTYFSKCEKAGHEFVYASCRGRSDGTAEKAVAILPLGLDLLSEDEKNSVVRSFADRGIYKLTAFEIYAALAIINSPNIIGRKTHGNHKGLAKRLANMGGGTVTNGWTELRLSVIGTDCEDGQQANITGEKCLHFCRSHLRVRNGKLERVKSHWRGNPALGVKQSDYRVTA